MDFETMDFDNLDPWSSLFTPMEYEVANDMIDFRSTDVGSVDFDTMNFGDTNFGITEPDWTGPGTVDLSTLQFDDSGAGSMEFDFTTSRSTDFGDVNLVEDHGAPADSGMAGLNITGFGLFENGPTYSLTATSDTIAPYTIANQRMYQSIKDVEVLERNSISANMTHNDPTGFEDLCLRRSESNAEGDQRNHSSYNTLQPSTAGPCYGAIEVGYYYPYSSTTVPHSVLPAQIRPGALTSRKQVKSGDWNEYRPKCLEASAPRAKITADEWQDYRPFLEQLYVVEGVKLKDVMKILETKFGFVATEKMYKTRITQWGLMKNYKATEKERLARIVKAHRDSGKTIPPLTLRNRAAEMSRVRRFCKQQKILEEICDALPAQSSSNAKLISSTEASPTHQAAATGVLVSALQGIHYPSSSAPALRNHSFDPERPFSTASKDARIELILYQMKTYVQSRYACTMEPEMFMSSGQLAFQNAVDDAEIPGYANEVMIKLVYGVGAMIHQKFAQGWRMLDEACTIFSRALDQPRENLFRVLIQAFVDRDWTKYPDLRIYLLRFFTKVSVVRLGCKHPISVVLYHLQEQQILADVVTPAFEVLIDVSGEDLNPKNEEKWLLKDTFCTVMRDQGEYIAAESYGLRFLKQREEEFGRLHWRTRSLLYELGNIHFNQGQYELAEREYQDILQRGREDLGDKFPDEVCIYALQNLAWIWEKRGDFAQIERHYREALAGAIKEWGMEADYTIFLIANLENSFKRQGMDPEAWLQQNFSISCI